MPPVLSTAPPTAKIPETSSWVLATGLLLGLLCLGGLTRLAGVPDQTSHQLTAPASAQIIQSSWRPSAP